MRIEVRRFKERTNLVIISESPEDSLALDELSPLGQKLTAGVRLADGYQEHYLLVEGVVRRPAIRKNASNTTGGSLPG